MITNGLFPDARSSIQRVGIARARNERGFSLVEMVVVVAIVGIILGFAAPAVQSMMAGQQVKNAATELYESLIFARSEAIKRAEAVSLVTDGFAGGWTIDVVSSDTVLREQAAFTNVSFDPVDSDISFNRLGRLASAIAVEISRGDTSTKRCVQVEASGKPRVINGVCP